MGTKGEELLWTLLWASEMVFRPTFRNLTESFEEWAYRNGFQRELQRLERRQFLEQQTRETGDRLYRLTETGRLRALGGRDPETWWGRRWDGRWRLVLFDVPEARRGRRDKLRYYLHNRGFGYLQNSVWVTPDPVTEEHALLGDGPVDVESLILLEARPCTGETDAEIVAGAWDFVETNRRYAVYKQVLESRPTVPLQDEATATRFRRWLREERQAWLNAMEVDPLLPERLLPAGYAGRRAWRQRIEVMVRVAKQLQTFRTTWRSVPE